MLFSGSYDNDDERHGFTDEGHVHKYVKKPIVISAVRWMGGNYAAINKLVARSTVNAMDIHINREDRTITIPTLEGDMKLHLGDWLLLGCEYELYPCKDSVFLRTYSQEED